MYNIPEEPRIRTGPYLQNPATDGMTISWMTSVPCHGYVEYGPTAQLGQIAFSQRDGLKTANTTLHHVRLTDLPAGQRCFYRVVCKPIAVFHPYQIQFADTVQSPVHSFTTIDPQAASVRFLVFNDLHDDVQLFKDLYKQVAHEPIDFVILNGDMLSYINDQQQLVDHLLNPAAQLFAGQIPMVYVRGNHDTRGAFARQLMDYLDLPGHHFYYGFSWGPVRFTILDSGEDKPDASPVYAGLNSFESYRTIQRNWLIDEINSNAFRSAAHRIVLHHIPALYNVDPRGDEADVNFGAVDVRNKWWPILNQANVSLFLAGHTHQPTIKQTDPAAGHHFPIIIGGGPERGNATVIVVQATQQQITAKMLNDRGETLGTL